MTSKLYICKTDKSYYVFIVYVVNKKATALRWLLRYIVR